MAFIAPRFYVFPPVLYSTHSSAEKILHFFQTILVESQDKALRRIAELKEQCQLEQKAKAHLEDALRNDLEEKDHLISTLHTKIELLKLNGGKEEDDSSTQEGSSSENLLIDLSGGEPTVPVSKRELQEEVASSSEAESVLKGKWTLYYIMIQYFSCKTTGTETHRRSACG
jgi:beta-glucosidase-like glycosyl hydrolase